MRAVLTTDTPESDEEHALYDLFLEYEIRSFRDHHYLLCAVAEGPHSEMIAKPLNMNDCSY